MNSDSNRCQKRLQKEFEDMKKYEDTLIVTIDDKKAVWKVSFVGAKDTIYSGESYTLQFTFSAEYVILY